MLLQMVLLLLNISTPDAFQRDYYPALPYLYLRMYRVLQNTNQPLASAPAWLLEWLRITRLALCLRSLPDDRLAPLGTKRTVSLLIHQREPVLRTNRSVSRQVPQMRVPMDFQMRPVYAMNFVRAPYRALELCRLFRNLILWKMELLLSM